MTHGKYLAGFFFVAHLEMAAQAKKMRFKQYLKKVVFEVKFWVHLLFFLDPSQLKVFFASSDTTYSQSIFSFSNLLSNERKGPCLFRVYRGLYYPVL